MEHAKKQRPYPDINQVAIVGSLVDDPVLKTVGTKNTSVAELTVMVNNPIGEPSMIDVQIWAGAAHAVHQYTNKGDQIVVSGRLRTDTYIAKGGQPKTRTYVDAGTNGIQFTRTRTTKPS